MHELRRALGQVLRQKRLEHQLSQESLADAADLHRSFVFRLERGDANISLDALYRLARALQTSGSELLRHAEQVRDELR